MDCLATKELLGKIAEMPKKNGVTVDQIAEIMSVKNTTLGSRICSTNEDRHFRLRDLVPYMLACGDFSPLDDIARQCGRVASELPKKGVKLTQATAGQVMIEAGEACMAAGNALSYGTEFTDHEREVLISEFEDVHRIVGQILTRLMNENR